MSRAHLIVIERAIVREGVNDGRYSLAQGLRILCASGMKASDALRFLSAPKVGSAAKGACCD